MYSATSYVLEGYSEGGEYPRRDLEKTVSSRVGAVLVSKRQIKSSLDVI